jgi:hypothetical protein
VRDMRGEREAAEMTKIRCRMWFWVDNKADLCKFCGAGGRVLKNMRSGFNVCPDCVKQLDDARKQDTPTQVATTSNRRQT